MVMACSTHEKRRKKKKKNEIHIRFSWESKKEIRR
jgi:hypothetical protein